MHCPMVMFEIFYNNQVLHTNLPTSLSSFQSFSKVIVHLIYGRIKTLLGYLQGSMDGISGAAEICVCGWTQRTFSLHDNIFHYYFCHANQITKFQQMPFLQSLLFFKANVITLLTALQNIYNKCTQSKWLIRIHRIGSCYWLAYLPMICIYSCQNKFLYNQYICIIFWLQVTSDYTISK